MALPLTAFPRTFPRSQLLLTVVLAVTAGLVLFSSLDRAAMEPDESLYALATDQLRASGEWWTLSPHPPHPYFNKPPLYMWLSALTYDAFTELPVRYRFWSALFGVAAVVMTGLLGDRLYRWEVGAIAGLLLLTNRSFLTDHGARFGGMDAGLTACFATILWLYAGVRRLQAVQPSASDQRVSDWKSWLAIGLTAGIACLLKPLGGLPMLAVVALHGVLFRRESGTGTDIRRGLPWRALGLVLLPMLAIAAPWYVVNQVRYPGEFASHLFGQQIAGALTGEADGSGDRPWWYYAVTIPKSSTHFALAAVAAVWMLVSLARDADRRRLSLLAVGSIGWILVLSVVQKKFLHYAYPAFVPLTVATGAMILALTRTLTRGTPTGLWIARGVIALLLLFASWLGLARLPDMARTSEIWELYQQSHEQVATGKLRWLVIDLPTRPEEAWSDGRVGKPQLTIYLTHLDRYRSDVRALEQAVASGTPVVALVSPAVAERLPPGLTVRPDRQSHVIIVTTNQKPPK